MKVHELDFVTSRCVTSTLFPPKNPMSAIRLKCLDCSGGDIYEIKKCEVKTCFLWPFRLRKNPCSSKSNEEVKKEYDKWIKELQKCYNKSK